MSANKFCTRNNVVLGVFGFLAVLASFLFSDLLREVMIDASKEEHPPVPEDCVQTILVTAITLNCLSLITFPFLLIGIHTLKTWMVLPWSFVTGTQTLAGGVLLWYLVYRTNSPTLIQCLSFYSLVAYSCIGITFCYYKLKRLHDLNLHKQEHNVPEDKVRILVY